ncbi:MAG: hypothetical protein FJ206_01085 [Gemmatimonadetes bacterium]|nr:hypothetical protein [Gemmatimonadota bacterium]
MIRILRLTLGILVVAAGSVAAQEPWRSSYFPYLLGTPTDGLVGVIRWQRTQNAPYFLSQSDERDVINPITFRGAFSAEAGAGTRGSRFVRLEMRAPGLVPGWRFQGALSAERQGRFAYSGVGSDLESIDRDRANVDANRLVRERFGLRLDVTRTIVGPVRIALGARIDRTSLIPRSDSSLFGDRFSAPVRRTTLVVRPALVLDTRDREFTPSTGVLLEAGAGFGTGRDDSLGAPDDDGGVHGFGYLHFRGYLSPREGTVVAGRALIRRQSARAPLAARFGHFGWERETTFAGPDGHRSFPAGAVAASDVDLTSVEVRHDLLNAGDLGAVTLVGFADRVRIEDDFSVRPGSTTSFGGGGGIALRVLRSAILTTSFATGRHGFNFSMGTNWSF